MRGGVCARRAQGLGRAAGGLPPRVHGAGGAGWICGAVCCCGGLAGTTQCTPCSPPAATCPAQDPVELYIITKPFTGSRDFKQQVCAGVARHTRRASMHAAACSSTTPAPGMMARGTAPHGRVWRADAGVGARRREAPPPARERGQQGSGAAGAAGAGGCEARGGGGGGRRWGAWKRLARALMGAAAGQGAAAAHTHRSSHTRCAPLYSCVQARTHWLACPPPSKSRCWRSALHRRPRLWQSCPLRHPPCGPRACQRCMWSIRTSVTWISQGAPAASGGRALVARRGPLHRLTVPLPAPAQCAALGAVGWAARCALQRHALPTTGSQVLQGSGCVRAAQPRRGLGAAARGSHGHGAAHHQHKLVRMRSDVMIKMEGRVDACLGAAAAGVASRPIWMRKWATP